MVHPKPQRGVLRRVCVSQDTLDHLGSANPVPQTPSKRIREMRRVLFAVTERMRTRRQRPARQSLTARQILDIIPQEMGASFLVLHTQLLLQDPRLTWHVYAMPGMGKMLKAVRYVQLASTKRQWKILHAQSVTVLGTGGGRLAFQTLRSVCVWQAIQIRG